MQGIAKEGSGQVSGRLSTAMLACQIETAGWILCIMGSY